jgi:hypothetical protein
MEDTVTAIFTANVLWMHVDDFAPTELKCHEQSFATFLRGAGIFAPGLVMDCLLLTVAIL